MNNLKKLKQIAIANHGCVNYDMTFPSGKKVRITKNLPYVTADEQELNFAAMKRFIAVREVDDKAFCVWAHDPKNLPTVQKYFGSKEEAKEFQWKDEYEDVVKEKLLERGYLVRTSEEAIDELNEAVEEALDNIKAPEVVEVTKELTEEEIVQKAKEMGYTIYKRK